jgi:hypothetical protein
MHTIRPSYYLYVVVVVAAVVVGAWLNVGGTWNRIISRVHHASCKLQEDDLRLLGVTHDLNDPTSESEYHSVVYFIIYHVFPLATYQQNKENMRNNENQD